MSKKKNNWKGGMFFWTFLILMLVINFTGGYFGLKNFHWHLFLHIGIVIFSFLLLIYSLKLNERAMKYIIFGSVLWILTNSVLFLGHVFEEYYWLETNLFTFLGMVVGCFLIMFGFKEGARNKNQTKEGVNG